MKEWSDYPLTKKTASAAYHYWNGLILTIVGDNFNTIILHHTDTTNEVESIS